MLWEQKKKKRRARSISSGRARHKTAVRRLHCFATARAAAPVTDARPPLSLHLHREHLPLEVTLVSRLPLS